MSRPDFSSLRDLHNRANDLLQSQITGQALVHHRNQKWGVGQVSEGSLRMLDMCGTTRDVLFLVKEHVHDLQSSLRRSIGDPNLQNKCDFSRRKKMKREMFKCLRALKGMKMTTTYTSSRSSDLSHIEQYLMVVMDVLNQVRVTTISILESILSLLAVLTTSNQKSNGRSFMLNFMWASRVASASEENDLNEMIRRRADATQCSSACGHSSLPKKPNKGLEDLEMAIEDLENELECIFRRLIQTRVSLLNILNS